MDLRERITVLDERGDLGAEPGSHLWAVGVRAELLAHLQDAESSAHTLRDYRDAMLRFEGYRVLTNQFGQPFRNFEAFCRAKPPFGLGYDPTMLDAIIDERKSAQARASEPMVLLDNRGPATASERETIDYVIINRPTRQGTDPDYLTARIARDRPDILEQMRAGAYPSVWAAAIAAGIAKPKFQATLTVEGVVRAIRRHFTSEQIATLVAALSEAP